MAEDMEKRFPWAEIVDFTVASVLDPRVKVRTRKAGRRTGEHFV